jgi:hypothetical protein
MPEQAGSLLSQVAAVLKARANQRFFMFEVYGPDGEILEASECWPLTAEDLASDAVQGVAVLLPDEQGRHAEPKRDWRERGVVPPRGFQRSQWWGRGAKR